MILIIQAQSPAASEDFVFTNFGLNFGSSRQSSFINVTMASDVFPIKINKILEEITHLKNKEERKLKVFKNCVVKFETQRLYHLPQITGIVY